MSDQERELVEVELEDFWRDHEEPLGDFIRRLTKLYESVPEKLRASAMFKFDTGYEGGGHIEVCYKRPQTDEEAAATAKRREMDRLREESTERRRLAELKAKYPETE